jgi:magnesium-transporting ATPase (P-type)
VLAIADPIKATTPEALAGLRAAGIKVVMLTGDNRTTAEAVARKLGIDAVEAEVLPDQKSAVIERLKRKVRSSRWRGRRQRCPGTRRRRCRHRHGFGDRRRDRECWRDALEG